MFVNRLLTGDDGQIGPPGYDAADAFLSWLRQNGQHHARRVTFIVLGSVSLLPILRRAGLSAKANIYNPFMLLPWDEETARQCLRELAATYQVRLGPAVRTEMCRRLRCHVPHHVQLFFEKLHTHLVTQKRQEANREDVTYVYERLMLGSHGQPDLDHYETRLRLVLGIRGYRMALDLLTEAAIQSELSHEAIRRYGLAPGPSEISEEVSIEDILQVLEHDGYLERREDRYRFVSGLLEDWWRSRHGRWHVPILKREV